MLDTDHLHRITSEAAVLAGDGVDGLDPETLGQVALAARRLRELADRLEVHALGALEPTGHTETTTGMSTAGWFSREAHLPSSVGRAQVTTARALRHLPHTDQAWLDGTITREHVRVLTAAANPRIRHHIQTLEPELIGVAQDHTFHRWRLRVADVVARLDTEGPDPDDPTHTTATWGRSGLFADLRARFAGADVELLEQLIEARTNTLHRTNLDEHKHTSDLPLLTRNQLRGAALVDLILHGHHPNHGGDAGDEARDHDVDDLRDDEATRDAERSDAETASPTPASTTSATTNPNHERTKKPKRTTTRNPLRVSVNLVLRADTPAPDTPASDARPPDARPPDARAPDLDVATLPRPGPETTWTLTNPDGLDLPLERCASLLCDAELQTLLVDSNDNPLNLGRRRRLASADQRRAVIIRDGGCVFPGCDCPTAWVETHHVELWTDGGTTDIAILAALCRRHHGITHRTGWTMHATTDAWFWWTTPSGHTFWSQRHGHQRTGPTPPQRADLAA